MNDDDTITRMRRGMIAEADGVPSAHNVVARIVEAAETAVPQLRTRRTKAWLPPAFAAVGVAAVVLLMVSLVGLNTRARHRPGNSSSATQTNSTGPAGSVLPHGFRPVDISFVDANRGWALGSVPCSSGLCTSLARTRDGGVRWQSVPAPPLALPGTVQIDPVLNGCNQIVCVSHVAFATPAIGYVFNGWQLFMSTDAGATWQRQPNGGTTVAIGSATVWRSIDSNGSECAGGCRLHLQSAPIGTSAWRDLTLPTDLDSGTGIDLGRRNTTAALVIYRVGTSALLTTTDDGATWAVRGNVCPHDQGAMDMLSPVIAPDQSMTVLCRPIDVMKARSLTVTSTDHGATFRPSLPLSSGGGYVAGAASSGVLFADTDRLYRSADAGATWHPVSLGNLAGPQAFLVRFNTTTKGFVLVLDSTGAVSPTIWKTTDAGNTWHPQTLP